MHKLPNFIFVGSGKSGSTSLYYFLKSHPQIYMSPIKETRFFVADEIDGKHSGDAVSSFAEYSSLFAGVDNEVAIGEMSPEYLGSSLAPMRIKEQLGAIRLLMILRNPIERALSLRRHFIRDGLIEDVSIEELVSGSDYYKRIFIDEGMYYAHISRYVDVFGRDSIYIDTYNNFLSNPQCVLERIYDFLGVNRNFVPDLSIKTNVSGEYKTPAVGDLITRLRSSAVKRYFQRYAPKAFRDYVAIKFNRLINRYALKARSNNSFPSDYQFLEEVFRKDMVSLQESFSVAYE